MMAPFPTVIVDGAGFRAHNFLITQQWMNFTSGHFNLPIIDLLLLFLSNAKLKH